MALLGYARVSSSDQSLSIQVDRLLAFGVPRQNIVQEVASARSVDGRPLFKDLLEKRLQAGDTLVVVSLDRFSRKILDTLFELDKLYKKGVEFHILNGPTVSDWSKKEDQFAMALYSFLAQSELENRELRVRAGIEKAKLENKYRGRKPKVNPKLLKEMQSLLEKKLKPKQICSILGIGRSTFYMAKSKLSEN